MLVYLWCGMEGWFICAFWWKFLVCLVCWKVGVTVVSGRRMMYLSVVSGSMSVYKLCLVVCLCICGGVW